MWVPFWKLSPGGNPTVLLDARGVEIAAAARADAAEQVMREPLVGAEQVGFLVPAATADGRMEMAGGELCINATRCAAAIFSRELGRDTVRFATSGSDALVDAEVRGEHVALRLAIPLSLAQLGGNLWRVALPGITHFVREGDPSDDREVAWAALQAIISALDEADRPDGAVGLMTVSSAVSLTLAPLVHVPAARTLVMETACGSGSVAVAAVFGVGGVTHVKQPSGSTLSISVDGAGVTIEGEVMLTAEGRLRLTTG